MKTRCPACGAESSLDVLVNHESARDLIWSLTKVSTDVTKSLVLYLGLFRPAKSSLSFGRMASLIREIESDITNARISRNGQHYDAPLEAWEYAFKTVLNARESGKLQTPLKSHGYLYEVIAGWKSSGTAVSVATPLKLGSSATMSGLQSLEALKHG